jgi:ABC-2 type transport system permease protein
MKMRRILILMKKSLNPRNPWIIFALLGPLFYAALFQFIFGLWNTQPKVAIYEGGDQVIVQELEATEAVSIVVADSAGEVEKLVEDQKVDVGAVFTAEEKEQLQAGEKASIDIFVNGESLADSRAIALAAITNAVRTITPEAPQISVEQVKLGDEKALSLMEMLLPFFIIIIIILGSYLLPASFIVNEKEKRTFAALLVTPATLTEVLLAFGLVGAIVSLAMGMILLLLTVGLAQPLLMLLIFAMGSILGAEWGLILGLVSKDQASLVAYMKALNIFILAPALFVIFPNWPQWIAKIFPTYYIANPIFRISIYGEGWSELGWQVLALAAFAVLFFLPILVFALRWGRSAKTRLFALTS